MKNIFYKKSLFPTGQTVLQGRTFLYMLAILFAAATGIFFLPQQASAKYTISDEAGLIDSQDNLDSIANGCERIYQEFDTEVYILTRNSIPTNSRKKYLEDYADMNAVEDAVMLLINMDSNNRGYEIQGYGSAEFSISDSRIEDILDEMYGDMVAGNYTDAINTYVQEVYYACTSFDYQDYDENPDNYIPHSNGPDYNSRLYHPLMQLACAAGIALIIVIIMVSNSGGKTTVNQSTYLDKSDSRLLARYDHYVRTSTSKRRKPSDSSGSGRSGGGGGGVSSGGRSHSGGGRSF